MTYSKTILRFALLTIVLGGATRARADEPAVTEGEETTAPGAESKGADESTGVEGKIEGKETEPPAKATSTEPAKPKVAREPAREPTSAERHKARERTARGLYLFEKGANRGALTEFEAAYDLAPSRLLLYRIASVYAAMGKPVDAVEDLNDLLADQGPLKPEILERARALKEEQQQQIGEIDVKVNVPALVEIDGVKVGRAPLAKPVPVKAGQHVITVVAEGYLPQWQGVSVAGSGQAEATFELQPMEGKLAYVQVYSSIPAVEVSVDDVPLGKTPIEEPVPVAPGKHKIELQRPGYMLQWRQLELSDGAHVTVAFEGDEDPSARDERGRLVLVGGGGDVKLSIDRRARGKYRGPVSLPAGPHVVSLEREDFEPMELEVQIPRGGDAEVKVALRSKGIKEAEVAATAQTYRNWAIASLVSGVVFLGGGTAFAVWSNGKLPAAEDNLAKVKSDSEQQGCNDPQIDERRLFTCQQQLASAQDDVDRYTNFRLYGIGGAALGAVLVGVGVYLLVAAPDVPDLGGEESVASTLTPVLSAGPDGASLLLRGRF